MIWILWVLLVALLLALAGWYLLIETEGVYLGRRVVIWLYDLYAGRYDEIKDYEPHHEFLLLAVPLMNELRPQTDPLVLDVATGTGRLPLALLRHEQFSGQVVGLDLSRRMLQQAASKLDDDLAHVDLVYAPAAPLPFPDSAFDAVTFLEALEFVDDPQAVLAEIARVLRPGGVLLTTIRINVHTMPGKLWTTERMRAELDMLGLAAIRFEPWQVEYSKVWAQKPGDGAPVGPQPLEQLLRCPACGRREFAFDAPAFVCDRCGQRVPVGADGVVAWAGRM